MESANLPTPIIQLHATLFRERGVEVFVKRDDLIHPTIMGNKWRKLKYNLQTARQLGCTTLKTFGGAYSNHIAATAAAGREFGFASIGIIRGDELAPDSNPTLRFARKMGMQLEFVSRQDFRTIKQEVDADPLIFTLPEGGTNAHAIKGISELIEETGADCDVFVTPFGTGGTMAGLIAGLKGKKKVIGISCLKGDFVHSELSGLLQRYSVPFHNYEILTEYHFGGYGRFNQELTRFMHTFRRDFGFLLDPIYTGKMFFGVFERIAEGAFHRGSRIMVIHTGGLQGIDGFYENHAQSILDT
ncbi:MAG: pyridoxal-phosphate dependent enzyme [Bacteroidota bacterium]